MQRLVENLERATRRLEASADDAADPPALLGQALAARQVDARELEQRDALVAGIDVLPRSRDQALEQRRAENRLIAAHRIGQADRSRVGIGGDEAPGVRLAEPGTDEHVLDLPPQPLLAAQVTGDRAAQRHRVRHAVEHDPGHLLDQIDLARDVARAHRGDGHVPLVVDLEAESLEDLALLGGGNLEPDEALGALGTEADDGPCRQAAVHVRAAGELGPGEIDDHPAGEHRCGLGEIRVDALLPAVRALGAEAEPLRGLQHADRLEVRRLQQHLGRRLDDLAVGAAHDRGQRNRLLAVRDEQVALVDAAHRSVERLHLLTGPRMPNDDAPSGELRAVECVQRAPVHVHDVVRHVDDVRDRSHPGGMEPRSQPHRRRPDRRRSRARARGSADTPRGSRPPPRPSVDAGSGGRRRRSE